MARFRLTIEYEGTRYSGWQVQKNARTVQGELIAAARDIFQTERLELAGAGRTDAGVHALGQTAHLEVPTVLAPEIICRKLNDALPPDINVLGVWKAAPDFHARHDATARSYLYQVSRRRTALGKRFVWWVRDELDARAMRAAAALVPGMRDMQSFARDDPEEKSTRVLVERLDLREDGDLLLVRIVGSHFLWKMVRRLVGVLVEVGRGGLAVADVRRLLTTASDEPARLTAPPSGLFLERVYYPGDAPSTDIRPVLNIAHG